MKIHLRCFLLALLWLGNLASTARGAVAFTVTPAAISNLYSGPITLQVSGLTNTETVVVQEFLDVNGNGVIDAGDYLWRQFNLTDGTNVQIGAVTNINVPGDLDTTPGQITAQLNFQPEFTIEIAANYLFKLSSPGGHFAPMTNVFTITPFPFAQSFTGTVVSNGVPVPNAIVILFQPTPGNGNNPVGGVIANGSGTYLIPAPAGTYALTPFKTNCVASTTAAANLVLGANANVHTNLEVEAATETISGKVVDASNSSLGLPGLLVPVQTQEGLIGICTTDTNGNFRAPVTPDQWQIGSDSASLAIQGYVGFQNNPVVDATTGSVAGVTIALPKATALFYGYAKDNVGNPFPGADIGAFDNQGIYGADVYTDTNGYYVLGVAGGLGGNVLWQAQFNGYLPGYIVSQPLFNQNGGTNLNAGQVAFVNFSVLPAPYLISGKVTFNGANVASVGVYASTSIKGLNYNNYVASDNNGNYSMNVANGVWNVGVNQSGGNDSLDNILGPGNYQPPNSQNVTINNNNGIANFMIYPAGGQIFGYVTDPHGNGVMGVPVLATNGFGDGYSMLTAENGYYSFNLGNGSWNISLDCASLHTLGFQCTPGLLAYVFNNIVKQNFYLQFAGSNVLQITTPSLRNPTVGAPYTNQLQAAGGTPPYTWTIANGSLPPPVALTLTTNGLLSGVPAASGSSSFSVRLADNNAQSVVRAFTLVVNPRPWLGPVEKSPGSQFQFMLSGAAGQNYTLQMATNLTASNWTSLYTTNSTTTNTFLLVDPNATNRERFYRVLVGP